MMDDYGRDQDARPWRRAPSAKAANCDTFLDRVRVRTGVDIEVIDGSEESRLTYLAVATASAHTPRWPPPPRCCRSAAAAAWI
jgi:hypothetical protein